MKFTSLYSPVCSVMALFQHLTRSAVCSLVWTFNALACLLTGASSGWMRRVRSGSALSDIERLSGSLATVPSAATVMVCPEIVCSASCDGKGQLATGVARDAQLHVETYLDSMNDWSLDSREDDLEPMAAGNREISTSSCRTFGNSSGFRWTEMNWSRQSPAATVPFWSMATHFTHCL
jgi:hypothetical protein